MLVTLRDVAATLLMPLLLGIECSALPAEPSSLMKRDVFPSINDIRNDYMTDLSPLEDSCVFYIGAAKSFAVRWAFLNNKYTLYDAYDLEKAFNPALPAMAGFLEAGQKHKWFQRTSRAYAQRCTGKATLVVSQADLVSVDGIKPHSIWLTDEYDSISKGQSGIDINNINLLDPTNGRFYGLYRPPPGWKQSPPNEGDGHPPPDGNDDSNTKRIKREDASNNDIVPRSFNLTRRIDPTIPGKYFDIEGLVFYNDDTGFVPGYCGAHIVQHQKSNPATDSYSYDVTIYDAAQNQIGQREGIVLATGQRGSTDSPLPVTLDIIAGAVDASPVYVDYGSQFWDTNSPQCSVGRYDSGSRQIDCGFVCY